MTFSAISRTLPTSWDRHASRGGCWIWRGPSKYSWLGMPAQVHCV